MRGIGAKNQRLEDANLLRIFREKAGQADTVTIRKNEIMLEYGLSYKSITGGMERLKEKGYIDFSRNNGGCKGSSFTVTLNREEPTEEPTATEETVAPEPGRRCVFCGTIAPNKDARWCWKCGKSLLSEKELLKEAFETAVVKIARAMTDSHDSNDVMQTLGKVKKMAFEEEA